jgi:GTPase SAR1 family protein
MGQKSGKPRDEPDRTPKPPVSPLRARPLKLVVWGEAEVGTTAIVDSFVSQSAAGFQPQYTPTIGTDFRTIRNMDQLCGLSSGAAAWAGRVLQVWDTAGQARFGPAQAPVAWRGADTALFVFDITSRRSFERVRAFPALAARHGMVGDAVGGVVLVGNKVDCGEARREVGADEGAALAEELGLLGYAECSAKSCVGVNEVFVYLAGGREEWPDGLPGGTARAVPTAEAAEGMEGAAAGGGATAAAASLVQSAVAAPAAPLLVPGGAWAPGASVVDSAAGTGGSSSSSSDDDDEGGRGS